MWYLPFHAPIFAFRDENQAVQLVASTMYHIESFFEREWLWIIEGRRVFYWTPTWPGLWMTCWLSTLLNILHTSMMFPGFSAFHFCPRPTLTTIADLFLVTKQLLAAFTLWFRGCMSTWVSHLHLRRMLENAPRSRAEWLEEFYLR